MRHPCRPALLDFRARDHHGYEFFGGATRMGARRCGKTLAARRTRPGGVHRVSSEKYATVGWFAAASGWERGEHEAPREHPPGTAPGEPRGSYPCCLASLHVRRGNGLRLSRVGNVCCGHTLHPLVGRHLACRVKVRGGVRWFRTRRCSGRAEHEAPRERSPGPRGMNT